MYIQVQANADKFIKFYCAPDKIIPHNHAQIHIEHYWKSTYKITGNLQWQDYEGFFNVVLVYSVTFSPLPSCIQPPSFLPRTVTTTSQLVYKLLSCSLVFFHDLCTLNSPHSQNHPEDYELALPLLCSKPSNGFPISYRIEISILPLV